MHYVYILMDQSRKTYVGYSEDLKKRVSMHFSGNVRTTRTFKDAELVWYCAFKNKEAALAFERYLKAGSGHVFAKKRLIAQ